MLAISLPLLVPIRIQIIKKVESKKCAFDLLTSLLEKEQHEVSRHEIFDALMAREKLGNTCLSNGIAIPRAHMKISAPRAALLIIKNGLDIETVDNKPIKVFLALITPNKRRTSCSTLIKKLNVILTNKEHIKIFTEAENQETLANYFESLLTQIMEVEEE